MIPHKTRRKNFLRPRLLIIGEIMASNKKDGKKKKKQKVEKKRRRENKYKRENDEN